MILSILAILLISFSLSAQDSNWQHYFHANYLLNIVETNNELWFTTPNSIFQFNEQEDKGNLLHFNNAPLGKQILDIYQENPETFLVLSGGNRISRWHAGTWTDEVVQAVGNTNLRQIVGKGSNGIYYLGDYSNIFSWDTQSSTITPVPAISATGLTSTQGAEVDKNGWLWFWRYNRLLTFNEDLEVMIDQTYNNYINNGFIDRDNSNVWLLRDNSIDVWLSDEQGWEYFDYDDFEFNGSSRILWASNNEILLGNFNELYKLTYSPDAGLEAKKVFTPTDDVYMPIYSAQADQEGKIWFFEGNSGVLTSWQEEEGIKPITQRPWLTTHNIQSFGMDQQGKLWMAGLGQPAYLMGGRWHAIPLPGDGSFPLQAGARNIVFSPSGKPVLGTGTLFSFGFPDSHLMAWDGMKWDTLVGGDVGNQFLIIRHIELDENNNLWIVRGEDQIFSVMSQGEWYHYKVSDMPIEADFFTCLKAGKDGLMWIGTNKGVVNFDGFNYVAYDSTALALGDGVVRDIAIDDEGVVWLNLTGGGIRKKNGDNWELVLAPEDIPMGGFIDMLTPDNQGGLWATISGYGLIHFDGKEWQSFTPENSGLMELYLHNIIVDAQGRLWCASYQGLSVYTPDRPAIVPYELEPEQNMAVFPNPGCCQFMVHWKAEEIGSYNFRVLSVAGQEIQTWSSNISRTGEQYTSFRMDNNLSAGVYFIQALYNGEVISAQQLIVN